MIKTCIQCGKTFKCTTSRNICLSCIQKNSVPKKKATCLRKYGVDNPSKSPEIQAKMTETFRRKYGVDRPIQSAEIKEKMKSTMKQKYDVEYFCQHPDYLSKSATRISKVQQSFMNILDEMNVDYEVEFSIESKCYDIYIKSTNIVVEVDPSYTHSTVPNHWSKGISPTYHIEKTLLAEKHEIRCIHAWDWDDYNQIAKLASPKKRIYARNCTIDFVDECNEFVQQNYLYDFTFTEFYVTRLLYQGDIVAILLLHKLVNTEVYELEYIPKLDTQVIGGLSKLWKHSINNYGRLPIVVHCDRSKFTGRSFQKILGLEFIQVISPSQVWSKEKERCTEDVNEETGSRMLADKWLPVYDCGKSIYSNKHDYTEETIQNKSIDYVQIIKNIEDKKKKKIKYCAFCGKPFHPNSGVQRYCSKEHSRTCPVCGKVYVETNNDNLKFPPIACSYECRLKRAQETNLKKYGCKNYLSSKEHQEKLTKKCIEKYGVPYAMMSQEIRNKSKNSIYNKYGMRSFNSKRTISKEDIKTIYYEDNEYIVFQSQNSYYIENIQLSEYVRSINKIPVVIYPEEDKDKVLGQLSLKSNRTIESKELTPYKLNIDLTKEFLQENDYSKNMDGIVLSIGLVKNSTIYQVIVFSKNKHNKNFKLKLHKICNKQGYSVIGGLDTLSTIASLNFGIDRCIAYQDQSKPFINDKLESIGMKFYKYNHGKKVEIAGQITYSLGTNVYIFE